MNISNLPLSFLSGAPSPGETLVIAVAIIALFGPKRLPGMLRKAGQLFGELRKVSEDFKRQVMEIDKAPPVNQSQTQQTGGSSAGETQPVQIAEATGQNSGGEKSTQNTDSSAPDSLSDTDHEQAG